MSALGFNVNGSASASTPETQGGAVKEPAPAKEPVTATIVTPEILAKTLRNIESPLMQVGIKMNIKDYARRISFHRVCERNLRIGQLHVNCYFILFYLKCIH
jgi:hypothetical protein